MTNIIANPNFLVPYLWLTWFAMLLSASKHFGSHRAIDDHYLIVMSHRPDGVVVNILNLHSRRVDAMDLLVESVYLHDCAACPLNFGISSIVAPTRRACPLKCLVHARRVDATQCKKGTGHNKPAASTQCM